MKTNTAPKEERELLFYQPIGYYQINGVWHGPISGVYVWKRNGK